MRGRAETGTENPELCDIFGSIGRDPFAQDDGGPPLEFGRIVVAAAAVNGAVNHGSRVRKSGTDIDGAMRGEREGKPTTPKAVADGAPRRPVVSVLEDLWKLDLRTLLWERVRAACGFIRGGPRGVESFGGQSSSNYVLSAVGVITAREFLREIGQWIITFTSVSKRD